MIVYILEFLAILSRYDAGKQQIMNANGVSILVQFLKVDNRTLDIYCDDEGGCSIHDTCPVDCPGEPAETVIEIIKNLTTHETGGHMKTVVSDLISHGNDKDKKELTFPCQSDRILILYHLSIIDVLRPFLIDAGIVPVHIKQLAQRKLPDSYGQSERERTGTELYATSTIYPISQAHYADVQRERRTGVELYAISVQEMGWLCGTLANLVMDGTVLLQIQESQVIPDVLQRCTNRARDVDYINLYVYDCLKFMRSLCNHETGKQLILKTNALHLLIYNMELETKVMQYTKMYQCIPEIIEILITNKLGKQQLENVASDLVNKLHIEEKTCERDLQKKKADIKNTSHVEKILYDLSTIETCRLLLLDAGVIPALVEHIQQNIRQKCQILNKLVRCESVMLQILETNVTSVIIQSMKNMNYMEFDNTVDFLLTLSNNETGKQQMLDASVTPSLLQFVDRNSTKAHQTIKEIINNLSTNEVGRQQVKDVVSDIVHKLHVQGNTIYEKETQNEDAEKKALSKVVRSLFYLSSKQTLRLQLLVDAGAVSALIQLLLQEDLDIYDMRYAYGTLGKMAADETVLQEILDNRVIPGIIQRIPKLKHCPIKGYLDFLSTMSNHASGKQQILTDVGFHQLKQHLKIMLSYKDSVYGSDKDAWCGSDRDSWYGSDNESVYGDSIHQLIPKFLSKLNR